MELQQSLRDKIISSICMMDMRMLDVILPDDGVYENAYKEVWLGKLAGFFKVPITTILPASLLGTCIYNIEHSQNSLNGNGTLVNNFTDQDIQNSLKLVIELLQNQIKK